MTRVKQLFTAADERLIGEKIVKNNDDMPQLLFLHGAGGATKERVNPLLDRLVDETGMGAFAFDFSGHGESSGTLSQSSLKKRVAETNAAWSFLAPDKQITVFGFSMGGHVAVEMLAHHPIANLVLFYPGLYTAEAYDLPFDDRFSNAIRRENSWQDAAVLDNLRNFTGNLLIVWGENDAVVPRGVVDLIYASAQRAHTRELFVVENGEHLLLPQVYNDSQLMSDIVREIENIL